ncbi:copper resistance protein C [Longimycelium tulufanense]|uniref:Copper resistance protein C n=1 Tax=Longimycelium tulufanense TaxID=907463 RepID=A0A8J3FVE4_9PSEU|nr:copper resistance CopC family protein [Longimycelium tulufanense]GGM57432.1 copper resistance protein C [Longimycelium tulufanense]
MRRSLTALALAGLALILGAGPALAHNALVSSDPADGSTLRGGPSKVSLVFDQDVLEGGNTSFNTVTITGPDGKHYPTSDVKVEGTTVTANVGALGPAGQYTLGYRILSADGHPTPGAVKFTVSNAGTGTPVEPSATSQPATTAADQGDSGGMPVWPWIVGAVVLLGAGVFAALRLGRGGR